MDKSLQLQIRVAPRDKRRIEALARRAGLPVSAWVLSQLLPGVAAEFQSLCERLVREDRFAYAFATRPSRRSICIG